MDLFLRWLWAFWMILVEAGGWLLAGFLIAGIIHAMVPRDWLIRQLGGRGVGGVIRATLLGIPIPLCSCSVIPLAAAIRRGGASEGASAAFAISAPEADAPTVSLTWGMMGPAMAVARPIGALITAITAGVLINAFGGDRRREPSRDRRAAEPAGAEPATADAASPSCCHCGPPALPAAPACCATGNAESEPPPRVPMRSRVVEAARFAVLTLPGDLARWMVLGLAISALVAVAVPQGWIQANLQSGTLGYVGALLLMLGIGIPLYICAASSTPLAAALVAAGLSPGAALVLLLAGPATNPATMAWVWRDLGGRALGLYLGVISAGALGAGLVVDQILPEAWFAFSSVAEQHQHADPGASAFGIVLAVVLGVGLLRPVVARLRARGAHVGHDALTDAQPSPP